MSLTPGARLGPYEIISAIGAGGMGEVYRATDSNLKRSVAIKVLPASVAGDVDRLARFQREAEVLAALNHPNIAAIYGLEKATHSTSPGQADLTALVMELVEGEDLSAHIARGPIPLADALPVARQIAEALEAAHEQGIVHRDLKPANIKVRGDGTVKVLDFGLAKAMDPTGASSANVVNSPTLTAHATAMGMIVGTAAYMAPEQARGKAVDKRADIWAFGVVLSEMLTGQRVFKGDEMSDVLAAVLRQDIDFAALPGDTPLRVRRLIERCLERDIRQRLRDIGEARILLEDPTAFDLAVAPLSTPMAAGPPATRLGRRVVPWTVAAMGVAAALALAWLHFRESPAVQPSTAFQMSWPSGPTMASGAHFFVLSPDGRHLAIVDANVLWVRSLDAVDPVRLDHTDGATYPFWSPDSRSIGFFAAGQIKRVARTGGPVQIVAAAPEGRGAAWSPNGTILFSTRGGRGLQRVPETGGTASAVTQTSGNSNEVDRYPQFLPDGERFLYLHLTGNAAGTGVYLGSLSGGAPVRILDGQDSALFAAGPRGGPGYLLFRRGDLLMGEAFDPRSGQATGAPLPVLERVGAGENTGLGAVSVSDTGVLAVWNGNAREAEGVWMDRAGKRVAGPASARLADTFALSADSRRLAFAIRPLLTSNESDVWIQDLPAGTPSKFTFGPKPGWRSPVWSPDASQIAYASLNEAGLSTYELRRKRADMTGGEETLAKTDSVIYLWDWAPDGTSLVYSVRGDLWQLPLGGARAPIQLTSTPVEDQYGQISPDGRWLVYAAGDRAGMQVFVQPLPATGALWLISGDGASQPRWRRDGKELFFRAADGRLMAAPVLTTAGSTSFQHGTPQPLFGPIPEVGTVPRHVYQPSADGQRFFLVLPVQSGAKPITMILNWTAGLKK